MSQKAFQYSFDKNTNLLRAEFAGVFNAKLCEAFLICVYNFEDENPDFDMICDFHNVDKFMITLEFAYEIANVIKNSKRQKGRSALVFSENHSNMVLTSFRLLVDNFINKDLKTFDTMQEAEEWLLLCAD